MSKYAALKGLRILVIEDQFLLAALIEETLQKLGCTIVGPLPNLDDAIAAIRQGGFDAALLDINLKGRAATPAAAELVARAVPFILVTGYPDAADTPVMKSAARVVKPFTHEQLSESMMLAFAAHR
jgi:CheY-like chemotaxis protein